MYRELARNLVVPWDGSNPGVAVSAAFPPGPDNAAEIEVVVSSMTSLIHGSLQVSIDLSNDNENWIEGASLPVPITSVGSAQSYAPSLSAKWYRIRFTFSGDLGSPGTCVLSSNIRTASL